MGEPRRPTARATARGLAVARPGDTPRRHPARAPADLDPVCRRTRYPTAISCIWSSASGRSSQSCARHGRPATRAGCLMIEHSYPLLPGLHADQQLRFRLKAVPATWTRTVARSETKRQDVIMAAWQRLPEAERADPERLEAVAEGAARAWLRRQGNEAASRCRSIKSRFSTMTEVDACRPSRRATHHFGAVTFEGSARGARGRRRFAARLARTRRGCGRSAMGCCRSRPCPGVIGRCLTS